MSVLARVLSIFDRRPAASAPHPRTRSWDGAGGGRRWSANSSLAAPATASLAARGALMRRARYFSANSAPAANGIETLAAALVGNGIRPQSNHPDPDVRCTLNQRFAAWAEDVGGGVSFGALQAQVARGMVRDGEALVSLRTGPMGLEPMQLDPDQLDASMTSELATGRVIAGVEFDARGHRIAYHVFHDTPDAPLTALAASADRIDARDVLHVFRPLFPGQIRGISWLAPVLLRLAEHDSASDALLVRLKVQAMFAGFLYDANGGAGGFTGDQAGATLEAGLEPGTLQNLPSGTDIKFSDPPGTSEDSTEFLRAQLREIAAGLGVTYEQMTGDLRDVNYSSIRAGLVEFRRKVEATQEHVLIPQLIRPIWRRWVTQEILAGRLSAPGFERNPAPWLAARFIKPAVPWVDPNKEIDAEVKAIAAGLKSRREAVAARGRDLDELNAERAEEMQEPTSCTA